jgi:simple sugar transport system ATP-binding protein
MSEKTVEMKGITKRFPNILANDHIDLELRRGEVCALLGENGAGKSTLMKILYGLYHADEGQILIRGQVVKIDSPRDAIACGIGMVHQHFALDEKLTAVENLILGTKQAKILVDMKRATSEVIDLSKKFGLEVDPDSKIYQLSEGMKQRIEILKTLLRGAQILIFDEPTAVLTPIEVKDLFKTIHALASDGHAIAFISHHLEEVLSISDRIVVLRNGKVVGEKRAGETSEAELARMMVGREIEEVSRLKGHEAARPILEISGLCALNDKKLQTVKNVSLTVRKGEIVSLAGVSGNGQKELTEVILGMRKATAGKVVINGKDVTNKPTKAIIQQKLGCIAEDRIGWGLLMDRPIAENLILGLHRSNKLSTKTPIANFLKTKEIQDYTQKLLNEFDIRGTDVNAPVKLLSGGNLQKIILARVLSQEPEILLASQPTRGLDVGATEYVHKLLLELRGKGLGILLISEDLEEILALSDTIAVMFRGEVVGTIPAESATSEKLGLLMAGVKGTEGTRP